MNGIDRVFVSALNTIKRLPKSPSSPKPPLGDRLLLYGLFKQAMEGDVDQVMPRPIGEGDEEDASREKWDAWHEQHGVPRLEAKKLYITTLIRSMKTYGSTSPEARELIGELEFVWNQVQSNTSPPPSDTGRERYDGGGGRGGGISLPGTPDVLPNLVPQVYRTAPPSPAVLPRLDASMMIDHDSEGHFSDSETRRIWRHQVEKALESIRTELASVRESILLPRRRERTLLKIIVTFLGRFTWFTIRAVILDFLVIGGAWLYFRRRGDTRAEEVRELVSSWIRWIARKSKPRVRKLQHDR